MDIPPLAEVRRLTEKKRDAWWTVVLVDPVATPLVRWTAKWTRVTPNQITWGALVLGLAAGACFAQGTWPWLIVGAVVYHVSFILDCMDGKLARLTGRGSEFGAWLDYVFDRVRVLLCAIALMGGQFHRTGNVTYVWLALAVVFLDMLRYIDALQIYKVRQGMRTKLALAAQTATDDTPTPDIEGTFGEGKEGQHEHPHAASPGTDLPSEAVTAAAAKTPLIVTQQSFIQRFPGYIRVRDYLVNHRIRTHLVSGIEFQMGVFIVAPLANSIIGVTVVSGALLVLFELAIIYKLLLSTRDFERLMAKYPKPQPAAPAQAGSPENTPAAASGSR